MLGTIEVHADEAENGSWSFAGSEEVESEEDFFRSLGYTASATYAREEHRVYLKLGLPY